jgi:hypothetical protein
MPGKKPATTSRRPTRDGQARVEIIYETRPDILVSHATGQRVALAHRIAEICTEVADELVRTTTLSYARSIEAPSSRLATIATVAADGAALVPPTEEFATMLSSRLRILTGTVLDEIRTTKAGHARTPGHRPGKASLVQTHRWRGPGRGSASS